MPVKKRDCSAYETLLKQLRRRLQGDVDTLASTALLGGGTIDGNLPSDPSHQADKGTETFLQEFTLSLVKNDAETLRQIDDALERLRSGQYGTCIGCGKRIPKTRLTAIPFTAYCVTCASNCQA